MESNKQDTTSALLSIALAVKSRNLLDFYPIGSIYMNISSVDPAVLFGGTWVSIEDKFLVSKGSTYTGTGGSATHTHGLSDGYAQAWVSSASGRVFHREKSSVTSWNSTTMSGTSTASTTPTSVPHGTTLAGTTDSGSTIPPYQAVYVWQRTA